MTRKQHFLAVQSLRDAVRAGAARYAHEDVGVHSLLGKLERFENYLCTTHMTSLHEDIVKLTLLRLAASNLNLYHFRRYPSQGWLAKYSSWCDDTAPGAARKAGV